MNIKDFHITNFVQEKNPSLLYCRLVMINWHEERVLNGGWNPPAVVRVK
jgi:hypothetical protein